MEKNKTMIVYINIKIAITPHFMCSLIYINNRICLLGAYHDGINDIIIVALQSLHSPGSGDVSLGHHQLNVLGLYTSVIHLSIIITLLHDGFLHQSLALSSSSLLTELISSTYLSLLRNVLNLESTTDARLTHLRPHREVHCRVHTTSSLQKVITFYDYFS